MSQTSERFQSNRRNRHPKPETVFTCNQCGYQSNRRFNVDRHAIRIHTRRIRKLCCNNLFTRKDDYYRHNEEFHSTALINNKISRTKYKLFEYMENYEDINNNRHKKPVIIRRSIRIQKQDIKIVFKEASTDESEDDDNNDINVNCYDKDIPDDFKKCDEFKSSLCSSEVPPTAVSNIKEHQSTFDTCENQDDYEEFSLRNVIKDGISSNLSTKKSEIYNRENRNKLPIKKRILQEISMNKIDNFPRHQNEPKIEKISDDDDKENVPPKNNSFNGHSGAVKVMVKKTSDFDKPYSMWEIVTQRQQEFLRFINFDDF